MRRIFAIIIVAVVFLMLPVAGSASSILIEGGTQENGLARSDVDYFQIFGSGDYEFLFDTFNSDGSQAPMSVTIGAGGIGNISADTYSVTGGGFITGANPTPGSETGKVGLALNPLQGFDFSGPSGPWQIDFSDFFNSLFLPLFTLDVGNISNGIVTGFGDVGVNFFGVNLFGNSPTGVTNPLFYAFNLHIEVLNIDAGQFFEVAYFRLEGIPGQPVQPVPEPGTLMLLGSGLVGLVGYGRRKFHKI